MALTYVLKNGQLELVDAPDTAAPGGGLNLSGLTDKTITSNTGVNSSSNVGTTGTSVNNGTQVVNGATTGVASSTSTGETNNTAIGSTTGQTSNIGTNTQVGTSGTTSGNTSTGTTSLSAVSPEAMAMLSQVFPNLFAQANSGQFSREQAIIDSKGAIDEVIRTLREQTLPQVYAGEAVTGAYNGTTKGLMANDLTARAAGQASSLVASNVANYGNLQNAQNERLINLITAAANANRQTTGTNTGTNTGTSNTETSGSGSTTNAGTNSGTSNNASSGTTSNVANSNNAGTSSSNTATTATGATTGNTVSTGNTTTNVVATNQGALSGNAGQIAVGILSTFPQLVTSVGPAAAKALWDLWHPDTPVTAVPDGASNPNTGTIPTDIITTPPPGSTDPNLTTGDTDVGPPSPSIDDDYFNEDMP